MNGVLLIDKPAGMTSRHIDNRLKAIAGCKVRIGHAGTLDPFATGLLPVLMGEATKLATYLSAGIKEYEATLALGAKTETGDLDGVVTERASIPSFEEAAVLSGMSELTGVIEQQIPAFSAAKIEGVPFYRLAREGRDVPTRVREVRLSSWMLLGMTSDSIRFRVVCSAGTYVRALGESLAVNLGTVGHLVALRRTRVGALQVEDAVSLETALTSPSVVPLEKALDLPIYHLSEENAVRLRHGKSIAVEAGSSLGLMQAHDAHGKLLALIQDFDAEIPGERVWRVVRGFTGA